MCWYDDGNYLDVLLRVHLAYKQSLLGCFAGIINNQRRALEEPSKNIRKMKVFESSIFININDDQKAL